MNSEFSIAPLARSPDSRTSSTAIRSDPAPVVRPILNGNLGNIVQFKAALDPTRDAIRQVSGQILHSDARFEASYAFTFVAAR
jgi:hypothetical protein